MDLSEVVKSADSVVEGAILFVDITDSTAMKEKEPEVTWIMNHALFFDIVRKHVNDTGGTIVKYLGDGVMIFYDGKFVVNAINAAICIQEEISIGLRDRQYKFSCTIGISEGKMRMFVTDNGATDYIGNVVDRASRLGSVASANAIFIDINTVNSAAMNQVKSKRGELANWSVVDYIGEQQKIILKGFSQSVVYHEVKWDSQVYGLKSQYITDRVDKESVFVCSKPQGKASGKADVPKIYGTVSAWNEGRSCAFIVGDADGKSFYTNPNYIVGEQKLFVGDKVYFIEGEPLAQGKSPRAMAVAVVGNVYSGRVANVNDREATRILASIIIGDRSGSMLDVFAYLGRNANGLRSGDKVEFVVTFHDKGPSAVSISKIQVE